MYQNEGIKHSERQSVCASEESTEGRQGGQTSAEREAQMREWILFVKDRLITWQVALDLGAHNSSRDAPEEQKCTIQ